MNSSFIVITVAGLALSVSAFAAKDTVSEPGGRLLGTGGVAQVEGAAGGGLTPWALIGGYGTRDQIGGSIFVTRVVPQNFRLTTIGAQFGFYDRVEMSLAQQKFNLGSTVPNMNLRMDVVGLKVKLIGDAVYDQDTALPQIAVGLQYKRNDDFRPIPAALGARDASGTDFYLSATKLYLAGVAGHNLLLNGTLRLTRANQMGLLGFGGDRNNDYRLMPEFSAVIFLTDAIAVGTEYRKKPDNLAIFREDDFKDLFIAWFPSKRVSLTLAWTDLGNIADKPNQRGPYLSIKADF